MGLGNFRSICLPYCLKKVNDSEYVVLNREYKPIGFKTIEHIEYERFPINLRIKGIDENLVSRLSHNNDSNVDNIFLYDDKSVPTLNDNNMQRYLNRLEILAKLEVEDI